MLCYCTRLENSRCWHTGKEVEGSYYGLTCGNGSKGEIKVQDVGFCQVLVWKASSIAEIFNKKSGKIFRTVCGEPVRNTKRKIEKVHAKQGNKKVLDYKIHSAEK